MSYIPEKGDIIWIELDPQSGREQAGHRPCIVVSPKIYNKCVLAVICPITNRTKGFRWEVPLSSENVTTGYILSDQVKNLDWEKRNAQFREAVSKEVLIEVQRRLKLLLLN